VVAINCFDGEVAHKPEDVREALVLPDDVPVILCDARVRDSAKVILIEVVQHALIRASGALRGPARAGGY
jgi:signal recognition particle receptor subunit beta